MNGHLHFHRECFVGGEEVCSLHKCTQFPLADTGIWQVDEENAPLREREGDSPKGGKNLQKSGSLSRWQLLLCIHSNKTQQNKALLVVFIQYSTVYNSQMKVQEQLKEEKNVLISHFCQNLQGGLWCCYFPPMAGKLQSHVCVIRAYSLFSFLLGDWFVCIFSVKKSVAYIQKCSSLKKKKT